MEIGLAPETAFRGNVDDRGGGSTLVRDRAWFWDCFGVFSGPGNEQRLYGRKLRVGHSIGVLTRVMGDGVIQLVFFDLNGGEREEEEDGGGGTGGSGCVCMGVAAEGRLGRFGGRMFANEKVFAFVRFGFGASAARVGVRVRRAPPPEPVFRGVPLRGVSGGRVYSAPHAPDDGVVFVRAIDPSGDVLRVPGLKLSEATVGHLREYVAAAIGHGARSNHIDIYVGAMMPRRATATFGGHASEGWFRMRTTPMRVFECAMCGGGGGGGGDGGDGGGGGDDEGGWARAIVARDARHE